MFAKLNSSFTSCKLSETHFNIHIKNDKSEPVSNSEKVRIFIAWYECS